MNDGRIVKASRIQGHRLNLRDVTERDAAFILNLRTHEKTSRYISPTSLQLSEQIDWLRSYRCDTAQAYFIIERVDGTPIGTVRMYDARGPSFCWGSWILKPEEPFYHAIESAMMIYMYGLCLGFSSAHFEVDKRNISVCRFHENFGARCVGQSDGQWLYKITAEGIQAGLGRYKRYLPSGIAVTAAQS